MSGRPAPDLDRLRRELAALTALDAPTGFEEPVLRRCCEVFGPLVDRVELDPRGNLYARAAGRHDGAPTVMLVAHADEIGLMVTHVTEAGFLRFCKLGSPTDMVLPGQAVRVLTAGGPLAGTVGVKPGHVLTPDEARRVPPIETLYVDVAAESRAQAEAWGIEPGTPMVFHGPLTPTGHPARVIGKAIDDRAGLLALIEVARRFDRAMRAGPLVFCVSVEEEIGLRGAAVAARSVRPDVLIALDTVPAGGTPELASDVLPWTIGAGPLIKVRETRGLMTHRPLRDLVRAVARAHQIPFQWIVDTAGITDATAAQQASAAVAALVLGLPRRYSHSAVEMLDLRDLDNLVELVVATLPRLDQTSSLRRLDAPV